MPVAKQSTPIAGSQGQKAFSNGQMSLKRASRHRSKKRSVQRLTKFSQMQKSSKGNIVTSPIEKVKKPDGKKFEKTLSACLFGYKARRIYNNPVVSCYRL